MNYKCNCGYISEITYGNFQQGVRCMNCSGTPKYTYLFIKKEFEKNDCELLEKIYKSANDKVKYRCSCGNISITTYSTFKNGSRCMKCSGKIVHTYEYIQNYFKKYNCILLSTEYINNFTKLNYICQCGNKSSIKFNDFQQGVRCKYCRGSQTEKIVSKFLEENYTNISSQPKFEWCKNKTYLPFDFLLDNEKVIIEVDGLQHFRQVSNWKSPEETQKRDLFKMKCALEHGYSIIRIFQEDIFNNTIDWKVLIKETINELLYPNDNKTCQVHYISKDPKLYDNYKNQFLVTI